MREIRCVNPDCQVTKTGRRLKPALLGMASSTGAGRVEIKCPRCRQMNVASIGTVLA